MSRLVLWTLFSLLSIFQISALAASNYHGPGRGAPSIFTNTGAESELGENAIDDPWDNPPPYVFGDNFLADSRSEATDEAKYLQLNIVMAPPSDQAQNPESLWLSELVDCQPTKNLIPNNNKRVRRQSDKICPFPANNVNNQPTPGAEAGTQPAPLVMPPAGLRQIRKPNKILNSDEQPKPMLEGDPVHANDWVCQHRTINYPVCADYEYATEMPLGSGSYELLMAKLCEDPFSEHFSTIINCFRAENWHYSLVLQEPIFGTPLTNSADDPANCMAPDILWCCAGVDRRHDRSLIKIDHLRAIEYPLIGYRCFPQQSNTGSSTNSPLG